MRTLGVAIVAIGIIGLGSISATGEPGVRMEDDRIVLETTHLVYAVGTDGLNQAFQDQRTSQNYLDTGDPGHFMSVQKDGQWIGSTAVELTRGFLYVTFGDSGIWAKIHVRTLPNYLTLELTVVNDHTITSFELAHLPLRLTKYIGQSLTSCRDDEYAAAVIALNIETNSYPTRGERAVLIGHADREVRLEGAKIAVLGCPTKSLLDIIEQIEIENGLPHPTLGGVWARKSPEQMKSLLYVDVSEDTADAMIDYALAGGFGYIVLYRHVWCASQGSYLINRENFPRGEAGLTAVSDKIHAAGLKFGMHNLDMIVAKDDPLVHPVPDPGFLVYPDRRRILATDIGPTDNFIPTTTSPGGLLAREDKSIYHGRDLRIGDEIIVYAALQTTEPFGFTGCTRGAHGTVAAAHPAGAAIDNFAEFIYAYYRPDLKSDLYDRIVRAEAAALDRFEFDYIYPDGIGQNTSCYPEWPRWYIRSILAFKLYHYTRREVLFAHGPISSYAWHVLTQGNTVDCVQNGIIEHFNRSLAEAVHCIADLLPFDLGWFGYFTSSLTGDATRPREMEYAWCKALAYGAPISLNTYKSILDGNGRTREIFSIIKNWEELKLAGYFPERIREQLKEPGQEFTLEQKAKGKWQVRPVTYAPDKYVGKVDGQQNVWTFSNSHPAQPLRVFVQPKPQLTEYGDPANVVLLKPGPLNLYTTGPGPMGQPRQTPGLEYALRVAEEDSPGGRKSFDVSATNKGTKAAGWGCAEVILDGVKDLTRHRALGTWVKGDGSGAYLHFTIESGRTLARDYYVRLDFTGWKYVKMPESAKGEIYDFAFPFSTYFALGLMSFESVDRIYVFLTNLPAGATAKARFSRLEALQETPRTIHNPGLTVNGESITFPVTLEPDWYLEYQGDGPVRVFDPNGFTPAQVEPKGLAPTIRKGDNQVTFFCDQGQDHGETVKVTVITRGKPLR